MDAPDRLESSEYEHGPVVLPQPHELSEREKDDAMAAYLMMFASWAIGLPLPLINLVASLVYFFINRRTSKFVAFHALQSLMFHIPVVCLNTGAVAWLIVLLASGFHAIGFFLIYLVFVAMVNILYIVLSIIALLWAHRGRFYYMPLFGRIAFQTYYGPHAARRTRKASHDNLPPQGL